MAPGITGSGDAGGRPRPQPVIRFGSCLLAKHHVTVHVAIGESQLPPAVLAVPSIPSPPVPTPSPPGKPCAIVCDPRGVVSVPLVAICLGRSGDKGDSANIGLVVRKPEFFDFLKATITEQVRLRPLVVG